MSYSVSYDDHCFIFARDHYKCRYCGHDGTLSFEHFQRLQHDHLLPRGNPQRDNRDFIVVACDICNGADNRFFNKVEAYALILDGKTPDELVEQRKPYVSTWRMEVEQNWKNEIEEYNRRVGSAAVNRAQQSE